MYLIFLDDLIFQNFRMTLVDIARFQDTLANDMLNYKTQVEDAVVEPLQTILNVSIHFQCVLTSFIVICLK